MTPSRTFLPFLLLLITLLQSVHHVSSSTPESLRKSPARIAILHMVNKVSFFQKLAEITLRNKRRYATRHHYEIVVHTPSETSGLFEEVPCSSDENDIVRREKDTQGNERCFRERNHGEFSIDKSRAPTFGKLKLALDACKAREDYWLLWLDADAMIVNQTVSLLDIVDDQFDILVASDWFMINAGVLLLRCSQWNINFLEGIYNDRGYDKANALDQRALNDAFQKRGVRNHVKNVPKWLMNVYTEEYRAGDFIVHFAGKLYEATPEGITTIAKQFDVFARADDRKQIEAFMSTPYLLNYYSGTCVMGPPHVDKNRDCKPDDPRRMKLPEPLGVMSYPNRYRQLMYRNPRYINWKDKYDVPGATDVRVKREPVELIV